MRIRQAAFPLREIHGALAAVKAGSRHAVVSVLGELRGNPAWWKRRQEGGICSGGYRRQTAGGSAERGA